MNVTSGLTVEGLKNYGGDVGKENDIDPSSVLNEVDINLPQVITTACCGVGHRLSRLLPVIIYANMQKRVVHNDWRDVPYNALFNDNMYSKEGKKKQGKGIEIMRNEVPKSWFSYVKKNRVKVKMKGTAFDRYTFNQNLFDMPEAQALATTLRDAASSLVLSFLNGIRHQSVDQDIKLCLHVRMGNNETGDWNDKKWRHIADIGSLMKNTVEAMKSFVRNTKGASSSTRVSVFTASDSKIDLHVPEGWKIIKPFKTVGKPKEGVWFGEHGSKTNTNLTISQRNEAMAEALSDVLALGECDGLFIPNYSSFTVLSIILSRARKRSVYFYHPLEETYFEMDSIIFGNDTPAEYSFIPD